LTNVEAIQTIPGPGKGQVCPEFAGRLHGSRYTGILVRAVSDPDYESTGSAPGGGLAAQRCPPKKIGDFVNSFTESDGGYCRRRSGGQG